MAISTVCDGIGRTSSVQFKFSIVMYYRSQIFFGNWMFLAREPLGRFGSFLNRLVRKCAMLSRHWWQPYHNSTHLLRYFLHATSNQTFKFYRALSAFGPRNKILVVPAWASEGFFQGGGQNYFARGGTTMVKFHFANSEIKRKIFFF